MKHHDYYDQEGPLARHQLLSLFEELSFREKVKKVLYGLRQPHDTGAYKYAKLQLVRLSAPVAAILVPAAVVLVLMVAINMAPPPPRAVAVQIIEPEALDTLDEIEELMDEPIEPPDPIDDMDFTPDVTVSADNPLPPTVTTEFSPQPAEIDAVAIVKSPVIMRGIFGNRSPGSRGRALREFGGSVGRSGITEGAVLRALRWLKKFQESDGSWRGTSGGAASKHDAPAAMTGFALLTFLAHGETPSSEEFGQTVERAIRWLIDNQSGEGSWRRHYEHQIAAYALCEAYALTKIPMIQEAAERAMDIIIHGQNLSGGWNYPLRACDRDDTSVMAWCAQALKAAKMAGLENPGLDDCIKNAIQGFKKNADPAGGFGYSSTGPEHGTLKATGLSGAGVLCMQLLGAAHHKETRGGLEYLETRRLSFSWDAASWKQLYYWYYDTQARFHEGGKTWKAWNEMYAKDLVKGQTVVKDAIEGPDGELKDIGYWEPKDGEDTVGHVMNTSLAALMLQVYYRYLPTYKQSAVEATVAEEQPVDEGDVQVEITM